MSLSKLSTLVYFTILQSTNLRFMLYETFLESLMLIFLFIAGKGTNKNLKMGAKCSKVLDALRLRRQFKTLRGLVQDVQDALRFGSRVLRKRSVASAERKRFKGSRCINENDNDNDGLRA